LVLLTVRPLGGRAGIAAGVVFANLTP